MPPYIDGFVLPVPRAQLERYSDAVEKIAAVWKEHGALDYSEYVSDGLSLDGTRSFTECASAKPDEAVIFGWVTFDSREARDLANKRVAADPRMADLVSPLTDSPNPTFDPSRMIYGGFQPLLCSPNKTSKTP